MELKIIMLQGLPGSGKSTWAKQMSRNNQQYVRVNKDEIREMIGYTPHRENMVCAIRDAIVTNTLLVQKKHIIVDDTNFHPKHEKRLRELAALCHATFEVYPFDTPLEQCIANDLKRPKSVGEKVIKKMWREYVRKPFVRKEHENGLQLAVICDLDGTLCLFEGKRGPYETEKAGDDDINPAVQTLLNDWRGTHEYPIIFMSGRDSKYREITEAWLKKHDFGDGILLMRPAGDTRKDYIVKEELYQAHIQRNYNICYVLDDRQQVVDMWRRNGLVCLQVAEGDF